MLKLTNELIYAILIPYLLFGILLLFCHKYFKKLNDSKPPPFERSQTEVGVSIFLTGTKFLANSLLSNTFSNKTSVL